MSELNRHQTPWKYAWGERTRFLGDAYQKFNKDSPSGPVKKLALVQTPNFVGKFLHEMTLDPAVETFGLSEDFRVIDPCCGTGHLLCQAFDRLWELWLAKQPDMDRLELSLIIINCQIHGIDYDPLCVQMARLRLTAAACDAAGVLPYGVWGHRPNVHWADALLPWDNELQPFNRCAPTLRDNYGEYRTASMMTPAELDRHRAVVERLARKRREGKPCPE